MENNNNNNMEQNENTEILNINTNADNNSAEDITEVEIIEKLETKGLKLKKSTKERLNELQSNFDDAETMVTVLLNQYDAFKIEGDSKFSDRKAEINKFNYLMDSLKNSFLNSLEMAAYMEEKFSEKFSSELKKRDKIIVNLQEDKRELKELLLVKEKEVEKINSELTAVKDSFSRVNHALTTVEKELKEKSEIMQNSQKHISALTDMAEEAKIYKEKYNQLSDTTNSLESELRKHELTSKLLANSEEENLRYRDEVINLKDELRNQRDYNSTLNEKIQAILIERSEMINKLRDDFEKNSKSMENDKNKEIEICNEKINKLREEVFNLKLNKL